MDSLLKRNKGILSLEQVRGLASEWNNQHCLPPLDNKEFEKQWQCATTFIANDEQQQQHDDDDDGELRKSFAELLVELAEKNTKLLFKDQYNTPYALVRIGDHNEILRLEKSKKFERLLSKWFYTSNNGKIMSAVYMLSFVLALP
jgi:hypothetical protein